MAEPDNKIPVAKKIQHETTIHNDTRDDEYFWLRDVNWPKVTKQETLSYLEAENSYTEKFLSPHRKLQRKLFEELKARIKEDDESYPVKKDNYYYYSRTEKGKNYSVQCRKKESFDAKEEIIFDANKLARGHVAFSTGGFSLSKDHNLLAYSVDLMGEERYKIYIKNLTTKKLTTDLVEETYGDIIWDGEDAGFFYTKLDEKWRSNKIYYHKLNTKQSEDKLIFMEEDDTFRSAVYKSSDKKYVFIDSSSSTEDEIWFIDLADRSFTPKLIIRRLQDQHYNIDHKNNEFYIKINDKGKNFRLVKVNVKEFGDKRKWQELVPHSENEYLTSFELSQDYMVVTRRINGIDQITIYDNCGNSSPIKFEEPAYSISDYFPTYESKLLRIEYSSMVTPGSVLEYDFLSKKIYTRKTQEIPSGYDKNLYHQERIFATAQDGTHIPISLVYKKNLFKKDGSNPVYLYSYGSYGISILPSFNSSVISLLDRGFVFAIAHVRGGDDLGFKWYESAKFLNKKLTFSDFIACSEHLQNLHYGAKEKFFISGGSAGGMLMGVVINERPELYKGVIARVPFVDVLNTMLDETLPLTPGEFKEWGNPKEKEYYDYIKSYSPYDNVKEQAYPSIFITAGLTDPRVTYWEPAKWVARLRAHNTSKNPILLYTEMESGHKGQSGRYDAIKETAKIFTFVLTILGMKE